MIFITTYNRPKMLLNLLKELQGDNIIVVDDGSDYDYSEHEEYCTYNRIPHRGKNYFWQMWNYMLFAGNKMDADEFIFLQDDLTDIDLEGLRAVETPELHALNLMDVGPDRGWSDNGYVDCNFKTNRATLEAINWSIKPVDPNRWECNPHLSSGVGQRLTQAFDKSNVPMILPKQNYASHGDHESVMNPKERKRNPLIVKTG